MKNLFVKLHLCGRWLSGPPIIRLGPWDKFVENSKKLTCLEMIGYRIKYSTVLWLLELQIRHGRKVLMQIDILNINSRTSNSPCRLFSKKIQLSGFSAFPDGSPSKLIRISGVLLYLTFVLCLLPSESQQLA